MEAAVAAPPTLTIKGAVIQLLREDITELDVGAFVYYAQPDLNLGSGFGGAIGMRGGASVQKELNELAGEEPLATGEVVVTGAGKLKADFILHAVGPRFREDDIEEKLLTTMRNSLRLAEEKGVDSVAYPGMGVGFYGIPAPVSAKVMLEALKGYLSGETGIKRVEICVLDTPQFKAFESAMAAQS